MTNDCSEDTLGILCLFADDGIFLASTRSGAETVVCAYQYDVSTF